MAYGGRFIDWLRSLTAKSTTIDGNEQIHIDSAGLSQKATLANVIRYGGGSPRSETIGNATITTTTDGALYLEVAGQTAGNARGAGAFDWQATRNAASNVASGNSSVAIGAHCQAGSSAVALGLNSRAAGPVSVAVGGGNATGDYSIALGNDALASGFQSAAFGAGVEASGRHSYAFGAYTLANNRNQIAFGEGLGDPAKRGESQGSLQTFFASTTDATLTPLTIQIGTADQMVLVATRAITFTGLVTAMCNVSSSSNFVKSWKIEGVITRDGSNNTRIVGTPTITMIAQDADGTATPSTWAVTSITADDINEALAINIAGQAGTTIRWNAVLLYGQIGF